MKWWQVSRNPLEECVKAFWFWELTLKKLQPIEQAMDKKSKRLLPNWARFFLSCLSETRTNNLIIFKVSISLNSLVTKSVLLCERGCFQIWISEVEIEGFHNWSQPIHDKKTKLKPGDRKVDSEKGKSK